MVYKSKDSIAKWMNDSAIPAVHVISAESRCWSKIGGIPQLGRNQTWPLWKEKPLSFLAQLDFAEIETLTDLPGFPKSGRAFFFYDQEQSTWGFDPKDRGSWVVLFQAINLEDNAAVGAPEGLNKRSLYVEKPVGFHILRSLPDFASRIEVERKSLSDSDFDELSTMVSDSFAGKHPCHQVGGFPCAVQNDTMELECQLVSNGLYCGDTSGYEDPRVRELEHGASDWVLLFQLDSDDDTGMMWGDGGMLYFWIRRKDLLRCDFSNVWMILQCS